MRCASRFPKLLPSETTPFSELLHTASYPKTVWELRHLVVSSKLSTFARLLAPPLLPPPVQLRRHEYCWLRRPPACCGTQALPLWVLITMVLLAQAVSNSHSQRIWHAVNSLELYNVLSAPLSVVLHLRRKLGFTDGYDAWLSFTSMEMPPPDGAAFEDTSALLTGVGSLDELR